MLDTAQEPLFDVLTSMASRLFDVPIVLVFLVDEERLHCISVVGLSMPETSRYASFCTDSLIADLPLIVPNVLQDDRFRDDPLVTGESHVRFYAGVPLLTKDGMKLGTFCILDREARLHASSAGYTELVQVGSLISNLIEQRLLESELRSANERFILATKASIEGIWDLDYRSKVAYFSAKWSEILGLSLGDHEGKLQDWMDRIHRNDRRRVIDQWAALETSEVLQFESQFRALHSDGNYRWTATRGFCDRAKGGALLRITGSTKDITVGRTSDPLTGLHNRESFLESLQLRIDREEDYQYHYGILFIDLDSFKRVNDSLGYLAGNVVLEEVGRRLGQTVCNSAGSIVCRLGGDEFVVLVDEVESTKDLQTYAYLLDFLLKAPIDCEGHEVHISCSIGVAFCGRHRYAKAAQILEDADLAMYRAKLQGKARHTIFSEEMRKEAEARVELESELRVALEQGQFEVWYQPKIWLHTGKVKGFEALIRWRHPIRGMISPQAFVPILEEIGLISELGRFVTERSLSQLSTWRKAGLVDVDASMAVNVSPKQLEDLDLLDGCLNMLRREGLPPQSLVLEITENIFVKDSDIASTLLNGIAAAGIGLDLDDFGTGYSSLSYLHRFPFRSVKIDRSFIGRMGADPESVKLVAGIVDLARSLKMGVIAEGVETEQQATYLRNMGCAVGQGYLFCPPKATGEIEVLLKRQIAAYSSSPPLSPSLQERRYA